MLKSMRDGVADLASGFSRRALWVALARQDISEQHKSTTLGPMWLLVNYLALVGTFAMIFKPNLEIPYGAAYIALGLMVWLFVSETIVQSVTLFSREESFIKGTPLPISVYVLRLTTQSVIRGGYMLAGCLAVILYSKVPITAGWLWLLPSILLVLAFIPALIILFAVSGAYFPDLQFIVSNLMRLGLFLTPIFWIGGIGEGLRNALYVWNPFTQLLEIIRFPVLYGHLPVSAFIGCLSACLLLWLVAIALIGSVRKRIVLVL